MKSIRYSSAKATALLTLSFFSFIAHAQQAVSLDEAIQSALANHPALTSSALALQMAGQQLSAAKAGRIPDLTAQASLQRNLIIPSTPVPADLIQGSGSAGQTMLLKFGTDWNSSAGLRLQYQLFDPDRSDNIRQMEINRKQSQLNYLGEQVQLRANVTTAYASAVLAREQLAFAVQDTLLNHQEYLVSGSLYRQGRLALTDLNQSSLDLSNSLNRFSQANMVYLHSLFDLAYAMGLTPDADQLPVLSDSLSSLLSRFDKGNASPVQPTGSLQYLKNRTQLLSDSLTLKSLRLGMLPTISLNATYGTDYYRNILQPWNTAYWYGNSQVALTLSLPLTREFGDQRRIRAQEFQLGQNRARMQDDLNQRIADLAKTQASILQYSREMQRLKSDIDLAKQNLEIVQSRFDAGRLLPRDVQTARLSYLQARTGYLQAVYNYVQAQVQLTLLTEN